MQFMGHYASVRTLTMERPPLQDKNKCMLKTVLIEKDF